MIAATRSWIVALDNISHLQPWLSDALCRLSTGGGLSTRQLYTDEDEALFDAMRPVIITGTTGVATQSDLLDRTITLRLPPIPDERRRPEEEFWPEFDAARPALLGALLDIVAGAVDRLPDVRLDHYPRMADFAKWVTAAEPSLGWPQGTFLRAYQGNRSAANERALDASVLTIPLLQLLDQNGGTWAGSPGTLLDALTRLAGEAARAKEWPRTPRGLTGALDRITPNLRAAGIEVRRPSRTGARRLLEIQRNPGGKTVTTDTIVTTPSKIGPGAGDGPDDGLQQRPDQDRHSASPGKSTPSDDENGCDGSAADLSPRPSSAGDGGEDAEWSR